MTDGAETTASHASATETHISTVFFTAERAYKLLKPLRTSFLDHSTAELRLRAIDDELELNRRMAPDVYLGTADVVEQGALVDRMLVMRRLPDDRRLTDLIDRGLDVGACLRAIARRIAVFHSAEPPAVDATLVSGREAVANNWRDNFADIRGLVGAVIPTTEFDRVHRLVERYLAQRDPLFQARIDGGFVRDGHGDLTAQDIFCLDDGPRILDCLAFDQRLRIGDVLADVAFLAMDLERLAGPEPAQAFLRWYQEFSNEHHPASLAHHYIAYRAHVRAKVAGLRHRQGDDDAAASVRAYHALCLRHLEQGRLVLAIVGGKPGTGKSTLAQALADPLDAMVLGSDELRKDLAGRGHLAREFRPPDEGIYSPEMTERTYDELLGRADRLLRLGQSVVIDASWNRATHRRAAAELASRARTDLVEFECVLAAGVADRRVATRLAGGADASDARPEILDELRGRHEPWPSATPVDTSLAPEDAVAQVLETVQQFRGRSKQA